MNNNASKSQIYYSLKYLLTHEDYINININIKLNKMNIVDKLNNTLGYLTAMSFDNTELSNQLVEPLNSLSEVISEVENSTIHSIVKSFPSKQELSKEIKNKLLEINKGKSVPSTKHDLGYSSGFIDCYDFMIK